MKKNILQERFQKLAGITPLYELEKLDEKKRIRWGRLLKDILWLIKAIQGILEKSDADISKIQNIINDLQNPEFQEAVSDWEGSGDIPKAIETLTKLKSQWESGEEKLGEEKQQLNEFFKWIGKWLRDLRDYIKDRYIYDDGTMERPPSDPSGSDDNNDMELGEINERRIIQLHEMRDYDDNPNWIKPLIKENKNNRKGCRNCNKK